MKKMRKIDKKNVSDIIPLSPMQEGMLFDFLKNPDGINYFEQLFLTIDCGVDKRLFEKAWNYVAANNESLRTVFRWEKVKKPVQIILKKAEVHFEYPDYPGEPGAGDEATEQMIKAKDRQNKFDLQDVPFRVTLCQRGDDKAFMVISFYHIILDGWSLGIILKEFLEAYEVMPEEKLPPVIKKTPFKTFLAKISAENREQQENYWSGYLKELPVQNRYKLMTGLPGGKENFGIYKKSVSKENVKLIYGFTQSGGITLAALVYVAWGLLLQRYKRCDDVIFGVTVSGRNTGIPGIENMTGLFINTIPLRINARPGERISGLLDRVNDNCRRHREFENTPLIDIKQFSGLTSDNSFFDSIVVLENYPLSNVLEENKRLNITSFSMEEQTDFDLTLCITVTAGIDIAITYNGSSFDREIIKGMLTHYDKLLADICQNPAERLRDFDTITEREKKYFLHEYNNTESPYPQDKTVADLFEQQAAHSPGSTALDWGGLKITYKELNEKVNRLARYLVKQKAGAGSITAIMLERSFEMVIACLAVLKAGGAYLPVETGSPGDRLCYIFNDSRAGFLLTTTGIAIPREYSGRVILLDDETVFSETCENLLTEISPHDLAYIIYTSGTTGHPKGVMIEHRGLVNYITWAAKNYVKGEHMDFPLFTSPAFDLTVTSIYTPLITGNAVVIYDEKNNNLLIEKIIDENRVGVVKLTPSHLKLIRNKKIGKSTIKRIIVGGEKLETALARDISENWNHQIEILNEYGPTETVVGCMIYKYDRHKDTGVSVPIGTPADNVHIYLLDRNNRLVPPGVAGEIYISGHGVARGYLNKKALTAEKFIPNPFCKEFENRRDFRRIYKSGDLGIFLTDGNLEFLDREDEQVKIRGHRVEITEIECHLTGCRDIEDAAVIVKEKGYENQYLCAYYVSPYEIPAIEISKYLHKKIPEFMVPARFCRLERMPLTVNGKVDKTALPDIKEGRRDLQEPFVSAGTDLEKILVGIWKEVLAMEKVGIHDKFFEVGGNSFNIIQVSNRVKETLDHALPLVKFFEFPTIALMAKHLEERLNDEEEEILADENSEKEPGSEKKSSRSKDIAVIGISGKFPGAQNTGEYWKNLANGKESISFFSDEELKENGFSAELLENPRFVKAKGIIEGIEYFDERFFGYTPKEASIMDPQIRLLHECVWNSLEDAGYTSDKYAGLIGLYVGATSNLYWTTGLLDSITGLSEQFEAGALNDTYSLSTRIAYKLNLKGPAISLQTACSTSLVAIHMACKALKDGDCDIAVAGGASIIFPQKSGYLYQEGMVKSPDGHCRAFDIEAKGLNGGDGGGAVTLKRLEEALEDGDYIYAVIKGSAVNNDGARKIGYTAPSVEGQIEVIRKAVDEAEIKPDTISYVEAHGTGTPLGDSVEIEALTRAFNTRKRGFCRIGSVKTNIGHLDAAAGVAGFIKTVLALKNRQIPPNLHYTKPNPNIDFENSPFVVNAALSDWTGVPTPLRAGISSFGIGGTNAHVILEEAPGRKKCSGETGWELIPLSASSEEALDRMTKNLAGYLKENPLAALSDIACTLQLGRKDFNYRRSFIHSSPEKLADEIGAGIQKGSLSISVTDNHEKSVVFMFPGQGAQYVDMGRELYRNEPVFRRELDSCFELLGPLAGIDFKNILYPREKAGQDNGLIHKTSVTQPLLFIFEYALAKLLMDWGIKPRAMIGYSFGEYVAACLAGVFSLEDALELVLLRGKLMQDMPAGTMLSVPLGEKELAPYLNDQLSLAVVNDPSCIVAGSKQAILDFEKKMKKKRCLCMPVNVSHAGHSSVMDRALKKFEAKVKTVKLNKPQIPFVSNISGDWVTAGEVTSPQYWVKQLRDTVRFSDGVKKILEKENLFFVETGPGRDLIIMIDRHLNREADQWAVNTIRLPDTDCSDSYYLLDKVGLLWSLGLNIDWKKLYRGSRRRRIPLPTYPFERNYFPVDNRLTDNRLPAALPGSGSLFKKKNPENWFYLPVWKEANLRPGKPEKLQKEALWLIFLNRCAIGRPLIAELEALGQRLIIVEQGKEYKKINNGSFIINPENEDGYRQFAGELVAARQSPDHVVHLWSVQEESASQEQGGEIEAGLYSGFYSLLFLAREFGMNSISNPMHWWVVTGNIHDLPGDKDISPENATILSPCKVIAQEFRNIKTHNLDITTAEKNNREVRNVVRQLMKEFSLCMHEPVVAFRDNRRWIQDYESTPLKPQNSGGSPLRKEGVYLITGGLGYIGLHLAEYLARETRAKLALVSRKKLPPRQEWDSFVSENNSNETLRQIILKLRQLERFGAGVEVFSADVSDLDGMQEVLETVEREFGPLNGIIHAAGVTGDLSFKSTEETTVEFCRMHFQTKMSGVIVLEKLLKDRNPDFCYFMSSLSPILGGLGFFAYSAANLFMDAFVRRHNRRYDNRWTIINWDGWQLEQEYRIGAGASLAGILIEPEEGKQIFDLILGLGSIERIIVSTSDLLLRIKQWVKMDEESLGGRGRDKKAGRRYRRPNLSGLYMAPRSKTEKVLAAIWENFFGMDQIGIRDDFFELGGDSLKAISVVQIIHRELDVQVPLTKLFKMPTIEKLSVYICQAGRSIYNSIKPAEQKKYYELSSAQKRLYLMQQLDLQNTGYNEITCVLLEGRLDTIKLERTLNKMAERHESLRTSFQIIDGEPVQQISGRAGIRIRILDPGERDPGDKDVVADLIRSFNQPFDLSKVPLFKTGLLKLADDKHLLLLDIHHIISDGVSQDIFIHDFVELYKGNPLAELEIQYKDFSEWQNQILNQDIMKKQRDFWLNTLKGAPVMNLPVSRVRKKERGFAGGKIFFELGKEVTASLKKMALEEDVTLFMVFIGIYTVLMSKLCGQADIIIGIPIAGRNHLNLQHILGMFVNMLALRNFPAGEKLFSGFVREVKANTLDAFDHQDYQFENLVKDLGVSRDLSRHPVFDVVFALQNMVGAELEIPGLKISPYEYDNRISRFDLMMIGIEVQGNMKFTFEYSTELFDKETIAGFIRYFKEIIRQVTDDKNIKLCDITVSHDLVESDSKYLHELRDDFLF